MTRRLIAFAAALTLGLASAPVVHAHPVSGSSHNATGASAVESRVLTLINNGRASIGKGRLSSHDGLRSVARQHSVSMSRHGGLTHAGFHDRVRRAGFSGNFAACENVAYFRPAQGASTERVAQKLYSLWLNSPGHKRCMFDLRSRGFNRAGVGVFLDRSGRWWGTFEAARRA
ncbi:MAG TPA: CAP domain-containing protein [Actinomycetota bacterium]|nr:CAP domain-containing protein [Actinomycetota bacterium]